MNPHDGQGLGKQLPNRFLFVIGAMKSGTTSLFEVLSQHPEICPSRTKEPDFFAADRGDDKLRDYLRLWQWDISRHKYALEASVSYAKAPFIPGVPERIFAANLGQYRFIYMLRDPISRIESQVRHGLFARWGQSLDEGVTEDLIAFSSYAFQLENYLHYFNHDDILLIILEEFETDPYSVLNRVCTFLDIDSEFRFSGVSRHHNSGDFFNASPIVARASQNPLAKFLSRHILPSVGKRWLRDRLSKTAPTTRSPSVVQRWQLTSEERIHVLEALRHDLNRLQTQFGVDIHKYWNVT